MTLQYETIWEMVYHNPTVVDGTPSRLLLKLAKKHPKALHGEALFDWLAEHKDPIARAVIKALKSKTGISKYQFITIFKVPFYTDLNNKTPSDRL